MSQSSRSSCQADILSSSSVFSPVHLTLHGSPQPSGGIRYLRMNPLIVGGKIAYPLPVRELGCPSESRESNPISDDKNESQLRRYCQEPARKQL